MIETAWNGGWPRGAALLIGARDRGLLGRVGLLRLLLLLVLLLGLFRDGRLVLRLLRPLHLLVARQRGLRGESSEYDGDSGCELAHVDLGSGRALPASRSMARSEEHTSEL